LPDGICYKWLAWARREALNCKGPSHKKEESTRRKAHRVRYPKQSAAQWGHLQSGGEVAHRPILRTEGMRMRIIHRKGWSEIIGGAAYSKAKRMLENE
jgi:hypothetical protein